MTKEKALKMLPADQQDEQRIAMNVSRLRDHAWAFVNASMTVENKLAQVPCVFGEYRRICMKIDEKSIDLDGSRRVA